MAVQHDFKDNKDVYKIFLKYLLWTFCFLLLIFIYSWQNIKVADMEYRLKKLEDKLYNLKMENKKLETEVSFLSSPERIGKLAVDKLGLVPVNGNNIIWIANFKEGHRVYMSNK